MGDSNLLVQSRSPLIHRRKAVAAGAVGDGKGQIAFTDTSGAEDNDVLGLLDQSLPDSLTTRDLSRARGVLKSMFSIQALSMSLAVLSSA